MQYEDLIKEMDEDMEWEKVIPLLDHKPVFDAVNHPAHYTKGSQEAIVTIEEAIEDSVDSKSAFLHGQVLKYLLRVWLKDNPLEDLKKSKWYLERMIAHLEP
jgi:hypothetical protein